MYVCMYVCTYVCMYVSSSELRLVVVEDLAYSCDPASYAGGSF
jgi:hypothetical protein